MIVTNLYECHMFATYYCQQSDSVITSYSGNFITSGVKKKGTDMDLLPVMRNYDLIFQKKLKESMIYRTIFSQFEFEKHGDWPICKLIVFFS